MNGAVFAFLLLFVSYPVATQSPTNAEMIAMGTPSDENVELVALIKKDLKLESVQVKVLIGPYDEKISSIGRLLNDLPNGYYVLVDWGFYEELTPEERKALIAHEMGHIQYTVRVHVYDLEASVVQFGADMFAIRYAGIDAVLSFLDKKCHDKDNLHCKLRLRDLNYVKKAF